MGRCQHKSGQSLVEFALLLPLLVVVLFGIIEIGILLSAYVGLTNSAREAARAGSIYQESAPLTSQSDVAAMDMRRRQSITSTITETLSPLINTALLTTTITYTPTTPLDTNLYRAGDTMNVSMAYTHRLFFGMLGRQITLRASSSMRIEPGAVGGGAP